VNLLALAHYEGTDLGYLFNTDFRHGIIRESLTLARFSAVGLGSAYTRDGLYAIYGILLNILFM